MAMPLLELIYGCATQMEFIHHFILNQYTKYDLFTETLC